MKYLKQFAVILAFSFCGELLHALIPLAIPASIYGIVLLFVCLLLRIVKVEHIREVSNLLIEIMPIMFIPAAVGLINSWSSIKDKLVIYIVMTIVTTLIVMVVSGRVTQRMIRRKRRQEESNERNI